MKRYLYVLAGLALAATLASCEKDKYGTDAGNDSTPNVVLKAFSAELPNDPDCDVVIRFAANNATTDVYYLAELKSQKDGRNLSDEAYADYVVSNGTKLTVEKNPFDGSYVGDAVIKNLYYENIISAVAVGQGRKSLSYVSFTGLKWNTLCTGTYTFVNSFSKGLVGATKDDVILQQQDADKTQYRLKNLFGLGKNLNFFTIDKTATDEQGKYQFARIPAQSTGLTHSKHGAISIRDVGYWQGDDSFVTTNSGYESRLYEDYKCIIYGQYYVTAGNAGYQKEYFVPNK